MTTGLISRIGSASMGTTLSCFGLPPSAIHIMQSSDNCLNIEHASTPRPAANALQGGPQACIVRQIGVWSQVRPQWSPGQHAGTFLRSEVGFVFADQVNASFQAVAV